MDFQVITDQLTALAGVVLVDLVMAGDNAIVIGIAAARVAKVDRHRVVFYGLLGAMALRILFVSIATKLLMVIGLTLTGGLLLLWVAWKMWRDIEGQRQAAKFSPAQADGDAPDPPRPQTLRPQTFKAAILRIIVADISMSLDNVLAVAGIAKEHIWVLVIGLVLSITLMGAAATLLAEVLKRYHWLAYIGLLIVTYVAIQMIYRGTMEVMAASMYYPNGL